MLLVCTEALNWILVQPAAVFGTVIEETVQVRLLELDDGFLFYF